VNPKTVASDPQRRPNHEPLYDVDPRTGATIEVFYGERVLTGMRGPGWFHWTCKSGHVPEWPPAGPFATSYSAYRDAMGCGGMTPKDRALQPAS